jgi:predicted Zn-dependent protease
MRPRRLIAFALVAATLIACTKVPITGRRQFNLIPEGLMNDLGTSTYKSMLAEETVAAKGDSNAQITKKVGQGIATAANQKKYDWRFNLIKANDTLNAWCLPGGKIAVYTGILPVAKNEAGLAFIMGHEVGHATAHHGSERLSQQLALLGGLGALYLYLDAKGDLKEKQIATIVAAVGVGAQGAVILPFSRAHEKEADVIGMMYMAKAGYPPTEAPKMWTRMENHTGGSDVPVFLSTHPSNDQRKANLREWMPQAKKRYKRSRKKANAEKTLWTTGDFKTSSKSGGGGSKDSGTKNTKESSGSGGSGKKSQ